MQMTGAGTLLRSNILEKKNVYIIEKKRKKHFCNNDQF